MFIFVITSTNNFIKKYLKKNNLIYQYEFVLYHSFSIIILSLPFTYFSLTKYDQDEIKADWQPPGFVFGIVWPILYLLLVLLI